MKVPRRHLPLTSALVLINTSSSAAVGATSMPARVSEVEKKLRAAAPKNINAVHRLFGPNDMLVHIRSNSPEMLLRVIDDNILPLKNEIHNKIASAETLLVIRVKSRWCAAGREQNDIKLYAWIFANTNRDDSELGFRLIDNREIVYVAHVIGRFDMAILAEAPTMRELQLAIDQTIRTKNYFLSTDTRIVAM
jgi:hypothetical protein